VFQYLTIGKIISATEPYYSKPILVSESYYDSSNNLMISHSCQNTVVQVINGSACYMYDYFDRTSGTCKSKINYLKQKYFI
jgi:hypothetical protein